jgi:hypothetical protein
MKFESVAKAVTLLLNIALLALFLFIGSISFHKDSAAGVNPASYSDRVIY